MNIYVWFCVVWLVRRVERGAILTQLVTVGAIGLRPHAQSDVCGLAVAAIYKFRSKLRPGCCTIQSSNPRSMRKMRNCQGTTEQQHSSHHSY
jgi:hypothetical protein